VTTKTTWPHIANDAISLGRSYLSSTRYAKYDIQELAEGLPKERPLGRVLTPNPSKDGRPPAEIVAVAQLIQTAETLLEAWFEGADEMAPHGMYLLGHQMAVAKLLIKDPGNLADVALRDDGFLQIANESEKSIREKSWQRIQTSITNRNIRQKSVKADDKIVRQIVMFVCAWRNSPELSSLPDDKVVPKVWEKYIESGVPNDLWPKKFHILTEPTVRKYLRMGGAIRDATPRKKKPS